MSVLPTPLSRTLLWETPTQRPEALTIFSTIAAGIEVIGSLTVHR